MQAARRRVTGMRACAAPRTDGHDPLCSPRVCGRESTCSPDPPSNDCAEKRECLTRGNGRSTPDSGPADRRTPSQLWAICGNRSRWRMSSGRTRIFRAGAALTSYYQSRGRLEINKGNRLKAKQLPQIATISTPYRSLLSRIVRYCPAPALRPNRGVCCAHR